MNIKELEIRNYGQLVNSTEDRKISGLAIPVNSRSQLLADTFYEVIAPEAITDELIKANDIRLLYDHDENRGTLSRSKYGEGPLELTVTERGLEFSTELPNTTLGNDVLELIKRNIIDKLSFCFWPEAESWEELGDGKYLRTITKFKYLTECSLLDVEPAYNSTEIAMRSLNNFKAEIEALRNAEEKQTEEVPAEDIQPEVQPEVEDTEATPEEVPVEQEEVQEEVQEEPAVETPAEEPQEETKNKEDNNKYTNVRKMKENKFSIARILRSKINHENLNDFDQSVLRSAEKLHTEAGLSLTGFAIPFSAITVNAEEEDRAYPVPVTNNELNATLTDTQGKSTIRDEFKGLLDPVFDDNILGEFTILTGLKNNIVFPRHNGVSTAWAEELAEANESTMKFDGVTMSPKRLTSYVTISKQLLIQSDYNVENIVRQELVNSIARKLQTTLFGSQSGTATTPQGLFYNAPSGLPTSTGAYAGLTQIEQAAEEGNIGGELKYIINPSIKQDYRTALKTTGVAGYVYEAGEVLGSPTIVTNSINGLLYGNLKNVILAQWGSLDITVDDITLAAYGAVRLVVNTYWDIKLINPLTGEGATGTEVPSIIVRVSGE